jgi:hypothetical protein
MQQNMEVASALLSCCFKLPAVHLIAVTMEIVELFLCIDSVELEASYFILQLAPIRQLCEL